MFHERHANAIRRCRDGNRPRRCLLRSRLPLSRRLTRSRWRATSPRPRWLYRPVLVGWLVLLGVARASGGPPIELMPAGPSPANSLSTTPLEITQEQARDSIQWLASLALRKAPRTYTGDKDWGEQKKIWAGIRVKRDGLKLKTHRRFRHLDHGRWIRYEVVLPESQEAAHGASVLVVTVHRAAEQIDVEDDNRRWLIDSSVTAPMQFTVQVQRWNLGVKLFSVTVKGTLRVRLDSQLSVGFLTDLTEIPPALVIDPRVTQARLELEHFEVDRVSRIGGDFAEEWGELLEDLWRDRFLDKQNEKIVARLNRAIDKERDDLRLSTQAWLTEW